MKEMSDEAKARNVRARMLLAQAVMDQAPDYVTRALSEWIRSFGPEVGEGVNKENVGVSDHATVELVNLRRTKGDA